MSLRPRRIEHAVALDRHHGERKAARLEMTRGLDHGRMLDRRDHEAAAIPPRTLHHAL
jgi:hypothetical protein